MAADLKGFFSNCFIAGEIGAAERDGRAYRDTIELSLGGRRVKLIQRPAILGENPRDYRGEFVETTTVVVADVSAEERDEVREMLLGLSFLLSFATSSDVGFYRWRHEQEPRLSEGWATVAQTGFFRPAFDLSGGKRVREFLEGSWDGYRRHEEGRQLRAAIHLYVIAETRLLPDELKAATMFILLENLKSTYAAERGIPFVDGYYRKPNGKSWPFKNLLYEMFKGVGMAQPDLKRAVLLRNEIVHAGISRMSGSQQEEVYDQVQDLAREYLLRLMGYRGDFRLYSGRGMTTKRI
ncbi:hypothetical protein GBA63_22535 (plasmid) [Rubrobacter tropicus]|uniref:Apea-like HEPN domain-containing protein n=1 Tax=Rubrobacter tropicus TaxID=2653851 RepID=A0A6G8QGE2_9ACTN|nr:hypothetical protein [Rubrobacter tropicus]QIN85481.1 hypothetical protein GBA63_22535 [Rubrobacter tropicus]